MPKTGGPATLYGVLYQILGSILWSCELSLEDAQVSDDDIQSARLVLEPSDGGDLTIERPRERIVEQWKSRRIDRSWTIREILSKAVPDLSFAVDFRTHDRPTRFRFRTEGRVSAWEHAREFFVRLRALDVVGFNIADLDDVTPRPFMRGKGGTLTELRFFQWIASQIEAAQERRGIQESAVDRHRRLCYLLANFEIPPPQAAAELELAIDRSLRPWVNYSDPEHLAAKRSEMCGQLLQIASQGQAVISPREFLQSVGLTAIPLTSWNLIRDLLRQSGECAAAELLRYQAPLDVRRPAAWPRGKPILLLTGEGGSGKSWQLASLVSKGSDGDSATVVFRAFGDPQQDLTEAARLVWQVGIGYQQPLDLAGISSRMLADAPETKRPWLTVLIDEIQSLEELRRLMEQPWSTWGIKLAATVPPDLGKWVAEHEPAGVELSHVRDFTPSQLLELLRRQQCDWASIPPDVRELLRRPLFARIYCELDSRSAWEPKSEYDIFSRFWNRLRSHPLQVEHPDDQNALIQLAGSLLESNAKYPWTPAQCRDAGLGAADVTRLVRIGWLNRESGRVAVRHNRLLNWAVAEHLADRLRHGSVDDIGAVCELLRNAIGHEQRVAGQQLGYVFMDLLWLVLQEGHPLRDEAHRLLRGIEAAMSPGGFPRSLYRELLPTLGDRVVAAVCRRVEADSVPQEEILSNLAASALVGIATPAASEAAVTLLKGGHDLCREVGVDVLRKLPAGTALEPLWSEYRRLAGSDSDSDEDRHHRESHEHACVQAFRTCIGKDPKWLSRTLQSDCRSRHDAWLLAELLAGLEDDSATSTWECGRETLVALLEAGGHPLARCISRFRDRRYVGLLERWARSGEASKVHSGFKALSLVSPDLAIEVMADVPAASLGFWQDWFDELYHSRPRETQQRLREIMARSSRDAAYVSQVYLFRTWRLDIDSLRTLFEALDSLLEMDARSELEGETALHRLLHLLGRVATAEQLDAFRTLAHGNLESKLADRACQWVTEGSHEFEMRHVAGVLLRMGGTGLTRLVHAQLAHPSNAARRDGIAWACVLPNDETIRLLAAVTELDGSTPAETGIPPLWLVQQEAIEAIAALGADKELVLAMIKHPACEVEVSDLRFGQLPISDADLAFALGSLNDGDPKVRTRAFEVIGVSGRVDHIPLLKSKLSKSAAPDYERLHILWALYALRANDVDSVAIFKQNLSSLRCRSASVAALLRMNTPESRAVLADMLARSEADGFMGELDGLALALARHPDTRDVALEFARKCFVESTTFHTMFRHLQLLELLGEISDPAVADYLLQESQPFDFGTNIVGRRAAAIRALGRHDRNAAFEAALAALRTAKHDRQFYPKLLLDLDRDRAIPALCEQAVGESDSMVDRAICVALRHRCPQEQVEPHLRQLLSGDGKSRRAAAMIIGWMGHGFLRRHLEQSLATEGSDGARLTMLQALAAQEAEPFGLQLLDRLKSANGPEQWCICKALFDLLPPEVLGHKSDPLWIGPAFDGLPPILQEHVNERYKDAKKQIDRDHQMWDTD